MYLKISCGFFVLLFFGASKAAIDSGCYDSGLSIIDIVRNLSSCGPIANFSHNFEVADTNKDGFLSSEEFKSECFKRFEELLFCNYDTNRDGTWTVAEFILGDENRITSDDTMEYIDANHDSEISEQEMMKILDIGSIDPANLSNTSFPMSYPEFAGFVRQLPNETFPCMENSTCEPPEESYWATFSKMDGNGDGTVSFDEFIVSSYDIMLESETFNLMDTDGKGFISGEEWALRLNPELTKRWFESTYFTKHDHDSDGKWNKTELAAYLQEKGFEDRHAWFIMYKNKGPMILSQAVEFSLTIPNPNFRIIVETDQEVLNNYYVKGIPHSKRT